LGTGVRTARPRCAPTHRPPGECCPRARPRCPVTGCAGNSRAGAGDSSLLMVTNAVAPDQLGGLQRYVRELSAALVSDGTDVTILTKRSSPELPPSEIGTDGVRIVRFETPARSHPWYAAGYPLLSLRAVARAVRRH